MDLEFNGHSFTWRGKKNGDLVEERLDRALINGLWQDMWPNSMVTHGTVLGSNHCPIIIQSDVDRLRGRKIFRFEAFWAKEEECQEVVRNCWARRDPDGVLMRWVKKINDCRSYLSWWSRNKFHKRGQQIQMLLDQLGDLQKNWDQNLDEIREKTRIVDDLWAQEESYWLQSSRGSQNWGSLLDCLSLAVTEEMNVALVMRVSNFEIKTAALKMGDLKAPGPDRFPGLFYHSFWDIVKEDVSALVRDLMQGTVSPCNLNATHIVLIPKVPHPESVSQFRPISLCNYSYKVLSKVLANRLKVLLPQIISPSQNAFVAGRHIQDNIGIVHEMFHFLKGRTAKQKFELGIKLDMHKGYDRVEWDFLDAVMERLGFCCLWRQIIMGCVFSVKFEVILNGQSGNKFAPSSGLKQGDPLSPYLFILVGEVLSRLFQEAAATNLLDGRVNVQKSSVYFEVNVPKVVAVELGSILGMSVVDNPGTYLGVPAIWGRSKKRGLAYVKGKVLGKIQGWK
ncbi:hypothetical protein PS2_009435 [Malus domestica]